MMAALWAVLTLRYGVRPGQPLAEPSAPEAASVVAGPWSQAEIGTTVAFLVAVVGWFAPGLAVVFAPDAAITGWLDDHLTEEVVALTAAALPQSMRLSWEGVRSSAQKLCASNRSRS